MRLDPRVIPLILLVACSSPRQAPPQPVPAQAVQAAPVDALQPAPSAPRLAVEAIEPQPYRKVLEETQADQRALIDRWERKGDAYREASSEWPHPTSESVPAVPATPAAAPAAPPAAAEVEPPTPSVTPSPTQTRPKTKKTKRKRKRKVRTVQLKETPQATQPWAFAALGAVLFGVCVFGCLMALRNGQQRPGSRQVFLSDEPLLCLSNVRRALVRGVLSSLLLGPLFVAYSYVESGTFQGNDLLGGVIVGLSVVPVAFVEFWAARKPEHLVFDLFASGLATVVGAAAFFLGVLQGQYVHYRWEEGQDAAQAWQSVQAMLLRDNGTSFALVLLLVCSLLAVVYGGATFLRLRGRPQEGWWPKLIRTPSVAATIAIGYVSFFAWATVSQRGESLNDPAAFGLALAVFGVSFVSLLVVLLVFGGVNWAVDGLERRWRRDAG